MLTQLLTQKLWQTDYTVQIAKGSLQRRCKKYPKIHRQIRGRRTNASPEYATGSESCITCAVVRGADHRLAGSTTAVRSARRHRSDTSDSSVPRRLRRLVHVHDRQQPQERALLRQVHRLLPDADHRQSGTMLPTAFSLRCDTVA